MRDPDLLRDLQKQFGVETLKEMNRELKPEDLIKCKKNNSVFFK